jgi:hypothetical protein
MYPKLGWYELVRAGMMRDKLRMNLDSSEKLFINVGGEYFPDARFLYNPLL